MNVFKWFLFSMGFGKLVVGGIVKFSVMFIGRFNKNFCIDWMFKD